MKITVKQLKKMVIEAFPNGKPLQGYHPNRTDYTNERCTKCKGRGFKVDPSGNKYACSHCGTTGLEPKKSLVKAMKHADKHADDHVRGKERCPSCGAFEDDGWSLDHCDICGYEA